LSCNYLWASLLDLIIAFYIFHTGDVGQTDDQESLADDQSEQVGNQGEQVHNQGDQGDNLGNNQGDDQENNQGDQGDDQGDQGDNTGNPVDTSDLEVLGIPQVVNISEDGKKYQYNITCSVTKQPWIYLFALLETSVHTRKCAFDRIIIFCWIVNSCLYLLHYNYVYMWPNLRKPTLWAHLVFWEILIWNIECTVVL